jgi:hypothetical protein
LKELDLLLLNPHAKKSSTLLLDLSHWPPKQYSDLDLESWVVEFVYWSICLQFRFLTVTLFDMVRSLLKLTLDVAIKPDGVPKNVCRQIVELWKQSKHDKLGWGADDYRNVKNVAYDGMKLMYSAKPIKGIGNNFVDFPIELDDEDGAK